MVRFPLRAAALLLGCVGVGAAWVTLSAWLYTGWADTLTLTLSLLGATALLPPCYLWVAPHTLRPPTQTQAQGGRLLKRQQPQQPHHHHHHTGHTPHLLLAALWTCCCVINTVVVCVYYGRYHPMQEWQGTHAPQVQAVEALHALFQQQPRALARLGPALRVRPDLLGQFAHSMPGSLPQRVTYYCVAPILGEEAPVEARGTPSSPSVGVDPAPSNAPLAVAVCESVEPCARHCFREWRQQPRWVVLNQGHTLHAPENAPQFQEALNKVLELDTQLMAPARRGRPLLLRTMHRPPDVEQRRWEFLQNTIITASVTTTVFVSLFLMAAWERFSYYFIF